MVFTAARFCIALSTEWEVASLELLSSMRHGIWRDFCFNTVLHPAL